MGVVGVASPIFVYIADKGAHANVFLGGLPPMEPVADSKQHPKIVRMYSFQMLYPHVFKKESILTRELMSLTETAHRMSFLCQDWHLEDSVVNIQVWSQSGCLSHHVNCDDCNNSDYQLMKYGEAAEHTYARFEEEWLDDCKRNGTPVL